LANKAGFKMKKKFFAVMFIASFVLIPFSSASARSPWDRPGGWYGPGQYGQSGGSQYRHQNFGRNNWLGRGYNDVWSDAFSDALGDVFGDFFGDAEVDITFRIRASGKGKGRGRSAGDYRGDYYGRGYSGYQGYGSPGGYYGGGPKYRRW